MREYSRHIKSFQEIIEEFEFASNQLNKKANYYNKLISYGWRVPSAGTYYKYNSLADARLLRQKLDDEIQRKYTLELTASFEAKTVHYFRHILKRKLTNPMFASYSSIVSADVRQGIKHLMFHHLIEVYKEVIMPNNHEVYSEFKNLVEYRNWLAHGRGWDFPSHLSKFDFQYSYDVIFALISEIPDYPEILKE